MDGACLGRGDTLLGEDRRREAVAAVRWRAIRHAADLREGADVALGVQIRWRWSDIARRKGLAPTGSGGAHRSTQPGAHLSDGRSAPGRTPEMTPWRSPPRT